MGEIMLQARARGIQAVGRGVNRSAFVASASAGALSLLMVVAAMSAELPSPPTTRAVPVRVHWIQGARGFYGEGKALEVVGDSLFLNRFLVWQEDAWKDQVGRASLYLPILDQIHVSRGASRHGFIGAVTGVVLATLGMSAFTENPWGGRAANRDGYWAIVGGALLGAGVGALIRTKNWELVEQHELRELLRGDATATSSHR